jgi:hypothetical protein
MADRRSGRREGGEFGDDCAMPIVIPIHVEGACAMQRGYTFADPHLEGPAEQVQDIVKALEPLVVSELGERLPTGIWLRGLKIDRDEALLTIAPNLACHGHAVALLAFDVMRRQLPDTDIYVGAAPA